MGAIELRSFSENLTVAEVALILRCSRAHAYNLLAGKVTGLAPIEHAKIGRRIIVRKTALLDWLMRIEKVTAQTCYDPRTSGIDAVTFQ